MSGDDSGPNEAHTTEEQSENHTDAAPDGGATAGEVAEAVGEDPGAATDAEPERASFEEGVAVAGAEFEKRKRRVYELPDGRVWEFTIKKLTGEEMSKAEDAATTIEENRNNVEVNVDSAAGKRAQIKMGVVDGPEGFRTSDRHVKKLQNNAPEIFDDLADAIENFSSIEEEERVGF